MRVLIFKRRQKLAGLLLCEALVFSFALVAWTLYQVIGLPLRAPAKLYFVRLVTSFCCYLLGLLLICLGFRLRDLTRARQAHVYSPWSSTFADFRRAFLTPRTLFHDLRLVHAISLMFVVFINLKHIVPRVNPFLFDSWIADIELKMFGGRLSGEVLVEALGVKMAPFFSTIYTVWYAYLAFAIFVMIFQRKPIFADEFAASFVFMWLLGIAIVLVFPTWGPCFSLPERFAMLPETGVTRLQEQLWQHKQFIDQHPGSPKGVFMISGFPSLHLAAVILCSWYLQRISPKLAVPSWVFTVLTMLSTLYFGWHYVIDDIGAVVLAVFVIRSVGRIFEVRHVFVP